VSGSVTTAAKLSTPTSTSPLSQAPSNRSGVPASGASVGAVGLVRGCLLPRRILMAAREGTTDLHDMEKATSMEFWVDADLKL
jgi:hypothetical protein